MTFLRELPRYRCHKEVHALKIRLLVQNPRGWELHFEEEGYAPHQVSAAWVDRHDPKPGGYLVVYHDGYMSYSPAQAFEEGYTLIEPSDPTQCAGENCTSDGVTPHSAECLEEASLSQGWADFGAALRALKAGKRVARAGWNGKGMWLSLSGDKPRTIPAAAFWSRNNVEYAMQQPMGQATVLPCITMKTATGEILMGWLASQTDMLAEDWVVVEGPDHA